MFDDFCHEKILDIHLQSWIYLLQDNLNMVVIQEKSSHVLDASF